MSTKRQRTMDDDTVVSSTPAEIFSVIAEQLKYQCKKRVEREEFHKERYRDKLNTILEMVKESVDSGYLSTDDYHHVGFCQYLERDDCDKCTIECDSCNDDCDPNDIKEIDINGTYFSICDSCRN